jgi:predicted Zn-ribbon and HTH transcriptional regulator
MTEHGYAPETLKQYVCDDCGHEFRSHANLVRCKECTSDNVSEKK